MTEEFRIIVGYENYSVSDLGNVKSKKTNKILKPAKSSTGYYGVCLSLNNIRKTFAIHRLVALAFIEKIEGKNIIDHIDNNPLNNKVNNLRWCTISENSHNTVVSNKNTSGSKGVHFQTKGNKWIANIIFHGISIHLGCFDNKEDAVKARIKKANEVFKFRYLSYL